MPPIFPVLLGKEGQGDRLPKTQLEVLALPVLRPKRYFKLLF